MTLIVAPQDAVSTFIAQHTDEPFYYQPAWLALLSRL